MKPLDYETTHDPPTHTHTYTHTHGHENSSWPIEQKTTGKETETRA
jgi:hypothetical protein